MAQDQKTRRSTMRYTRATSTPRILRGGQIGRDSARDEKGRSTLPKPPRDETRGKGSVELEFGAQLLELKGRLRKGR